MHLALAGAKLNFKNNEPDLINRIMQPTNYSLFVTDTFLFLNRTASLSLLEHLQEDNSNKIQLLPKNFCTLLVLLLDNVATRVVN